MIQVPSISDVRNRPSTYTDACYETGSTCLAFTHFDRRGSSTEELPNRYRSYTVSVLLMSLVIHLGPEMFRRVTLS